VLGSFFFFFLVSSLKSLPLYLNSFVYINSKARCSLLECRLWAKLYRCSGCCVAPTRTEMALWSVLPGK